MAEAVVLSGTARPSGNPDELVELLQDTFHILKRRQKEVLRETGLSFTEWSAIHLCAQGPVRGGELADSIGVTPAGVTDLVDRLEKRGLLRRTRDRADRRAVHVVLTEAGRRYHATMRREVLEVLRGPVRGLHPEQYQALSSGLRALNRLAEGTRGSAGPGR